MAKNFLVDSRDVRFTLFEMLEVDKLGAKFPRYADFDRDVFEEILTLAERIGVDKMYPANAEGDKTSCKYNPDTKEVTIPECYREPIKAYYESGFVTLMESAEIGGMGMPVSIYEACNEIFMAGCMTMMMYPGLGHGAMLLVETYGTDELKRIYRDKMISGAWGGTMCLTEPDAGSDVGALKTKAIRQSDGTFLISGQKIFITAGENDLYENIIHPVLARIEGDPPGTKGISIFLVPKYLVNSDGSLGERNDVVCSGIEHKMGIRGSATCSMSFGDNGKCVGYLLGQERQGMKIMFQMMNEARLGVGVQGLSLASSAYLHAVTYAKNRVQGVNVTQLLNPEAKGVPIVQHPDVKRMLMWMKSTVEAMRMMCYYLGNCIDREHHGEGDESAEARAMAEFLLPVCKAGCTDMALLVSSEAVQVYGGYGYCDDYPVNQYLRDAKITQIYEGTNGIQSMDLLMRKLLMNKDQYNYSIFKKRVSETVAAAKGKVDDKYIQLVERGMAKLDEVVEMFKGQMGGGKFLHLFMNATPFQQAMFMLSSAWLHLWSLTLTESRRNALLGDAKGEDRNKILSENEEAAYYNGRVLSSQFFIGSEFPKYFGRMEAILWGDTSVIKADETAFSGAPEE